MRAMMLGAAVLVGASGGALADNNTCRQSGGAWAVAGTIKSFTTFMGFFSIELASQVVATPPDVKSAPQPIIKGDCMVGWGAGEGRPEGCKDGASVKMSGPISFDSKDVAGIQVRTISCG